MLSENEEWQAKMQIKAREKHAWVMERQEEILTAFIAQHGCYPDEAEIVIENFSEGVQKIYVRKKPLD